MICRAKRKRALRGRNHAEGQPGDRIDALEIPARRAEYSLTESALSPFQAEPTQNCSRVTWLQRRLDQTWGQNRTTNTLRRTGLEIVQILPGFTTRLSPSPLGTIRGLNGA
jgi:hypothetical protein